MRVSNRLWLLPALALLTALPSFGQSIDGSMSGKVVDTSGAVIAGASIQVTNKDTGLSFTASSSSQGLFRFEHLPVGNYAISADVVGFKKVAAEVKIVLNSVADVIIKLEPGSVDEIVTIEAGEVLVETTTVNLATSFDERKVVNLPNSSGSELNLALLAPNITSQAGGVVGEGGSVGGNRPRNNNFTLDGVDNNDISITGPVIFSIPEAVQEFTLITNQYSAEFGRASAGQFSTVTKSGTNEIHGDVTYVVNNKNLNALDNLTKEAIAVGALPDVRPRFDKNRIAGTVGGPIIKNKLFYFGAFQYETEGSAGTSNAVLTPTAEGFARLSGLKGASQFTLGILSANVPAAPVAEDSITVLGAQIPIGTVNILVPDFFNQYKFNINIDQVIGNNDQLRYRFFYDRLRQPNVGTLEKFNGSVTADNRLAAFTYVHTFTPTLVNEFRLSYRRQNSGFTVPTEFSDFPNIIIDEIGLDIGPEANSPQSGIANFYQIVNNVSFVLGKHNFKTGIDVRNNIAPSNFLPRGRGEYDYATLEDFIRDIKPTGFNGGLRGVGTSVFAGNQYSIYTFFQDDYRVTSNLTFNLGVRYEYNGLARDERLQALNSISSIPGLVEFRVPKTDKNDFAPRLGIAYSPNFESGLGKIVFGKNGEGALRAGFGIGYDIIFQNLPLLQLPPQFQQELSSDQGEGGPFGTSQNFLQNGGLGNTPIPPITQAAARGATGAIILDHISPYTMSYTLDYQRQLARNWSVDVRYLGTHGVKQFVQLRLNAGEPPFKLAGFSLPTFLSAAQVPSQRVLDTLPTLDDLTAFSILGSGVGGLGPAGAEIDPGFFTGFPNVGSSIYHSGSVQLQRRFADGYTLSAAYTYSHTIDNITNELFTSRINPRRPQDFFNLKENRGNSALDRPHRFVLAGLWELPIFRTATGLKKTLLGGWQVSAIYTAESGQPFSALSGFDSNLNLDSAGDRAILNANGVKGTGSDVSEVLNSNGQVVGYLADNGNAEFIAAGAGVISTAGPNTLRSPGFNNWDFVIFKNFAIGERARIEFRAELFNAFNHTQLTIGGGTVFSNLNNALSTDYANVRSPNFNNPRIFASSTRIINLGLKIIF